MIYNTAKHSTEQLSTNFKAREFDCKCGRCSRTQIDTKLVEYLQIIRNHFGTPITITSGYRCPAHNAEVGGATKSKHALGQAADIQVKGVEPLEVAKYAESIGIKGIGLYDNFVHIDTRTAKYFWRGHNEQYTTTFNGATESNNKAQQKQTLRFGMKNNNVMILQQLLEQQGYDLGVWGADGHYGTATYTAVCKFQRDKGLTVDGVCGNQTWSALLQ